MIGMRRLVWGVVVVAAAARAFVTTAPSPPFPRAPVLSAGGAGGTPDVGGSNKQPPRPKKEASRLEGVMMERIWDLQRAVLDVRVDVAVLRTKMDLLVDRVDRDREKAKSGTTESTRENAGAIRADAKEYKNEIQHGIAEVRVEAKQNTAEIVEAIEMAAAEIKEQVELVKDLLSSVLERL